MPEMRRFSRRRALLLTGTTRCCAGEPISGLTYCLGADAPSYSMSPAFGGLGRGGRRADNSNLGAHALSRG